MNRRGFLKSAFASTATVVVAPACVLDELADLHRRPSTTTYVDMGRNAFDPFTLQIHDCVFPQDPFGMISEVLEAMYGRRMAKQSLHASAQAFARRLVP